MRVVTEFVSFRNGTAQDTGMKIYAASNDVEGSLHVTRGENVEQARGVLRVRSVIEGDGDVVSGNEDAGEGDACVFGEIAGRVADVIARHRAL